MGGGCGRGDLRRTVVVVITPVEEGRKGCPGSRRPCDRCTREGGPSADQTAQATTRVADVVERRATGADLKPWRIEKGGGGQWDFYLVNLTSTPKYGVTLAGEPVADADENTFDVIDGNSSVAINVVTYAQMQDRAITINWYPTEEHSGTALTQKTELRG